MDLLPPRWVDVQDEVNETLAEIAQKSTRLDKLHQKHVLPGFGDEMARKEEERLIEQLTQEITRGFHTCQNAIQRIETMVREAKQLGGVSQGDETMARNLQTSLASRVQDASARFRKKQSTYLKSESTAFLYSAEQRQLIFLQSYANWKECRPHSTDQERRSRIPTPIPR